MIASTEVEQVGSLPSRSASGNASSIPTTAYAPHAPLRASRQAYTLAEWPNR